MTRRARPATIARLRDLQHGGILAAKEYARVIKALDDDTAGLAARELHELLLKDHGLDLREDKINKSRYIGRLLYALDPQAGDPRELDGIDDPETLYQLQRLHEVKGTPLPALLTTLTAYREQGLSVVQIRQRLKDAVAKAQNKPTAQSKATWRQPLMRVPGDLCDTLNTRFSAYSKAQGATQQQSAEALAELLAQPLSLLPADVQERLNVSLTVHFAALGMDMEKGVLLLCELLDHLPEVHWKSLYRAVKPTKEKKSA